MVGFDGRLFNCFNSLDHVATKTVNKNAKLQFQELKNKSELWNVHKYWIWVCNLYKSHDFISLVVPTPLKNISQNGNILQIGAKMKTIWNHHRVIYHLFYFSSAQETHQSTSCLFGCSNSFGLLCRRKSGCFSCLRLDQNDRFLYDKIQHQLDEYHGISLPETNSKFAPPGKGNSYWKPPLPFKLLVSGMVKNIYTNEK